MRLSSPVPHAFVDAGSRGFTLAGAVILLTLCETWYRASATFWGWGAKIRAGTGQEPANDPADF